MKTNAFYLNELGNAALQVAPFFTYLSDDEYSEVYELRLWEPLGRLSQTNIPAPAPECWSTFRNFILTAGMPLAALPVESLYKPWRTNDSALNAQLGLYKGPSARHIESICDEIGLEIPTSFKAMPDHLSILLELLSLFAQSNNSQAVLTLINDHFDWIGSYDNALEERLKQSQGASAFSAMQAHCLEQGIVFMRSLVAALDKALHSNEVMPSVS